MNTRVRAGTCLRVCMAAYKASVAPHHCGSLQHWDKLANGEKSRVQLIVPAKKTTHGFDIQRTRIANGRTAFSIARVTSWLRHARHAVSITSRQDLGIRRVDPGSLHCAG